MNSIELARNDGRDGRPAYIAVSGTVYDVTTSQRWKDGSHEGTHQAGQDLTEALKSAPHVRAVIERFPVVGKLEIAAPAQAGKKFPLPLVVGIGIIVLIAVALLL